MFLCGITACSLFIIIVCALGTSVDSGSKLSRVLGEMGKLRNNRIRNHYYYSDPPYPPKPILKSQQLSSDGGGENAQQVVIFPSPPNATSETAGKGTIFDTRKNAIAFVQSEVDSKS